MKTLTFLARATLLSCVLFGLVACGGGGGAVQPPPVMVPTITSQPASQSVIAGASATFTVAATGDAPLNYQWLRGGVDVPGASSHTFILPSAQIADNGSVWSARVSNAAGQVVSAGATLTVQAPPTGTLTLVAGSLELTSNGEGTADGNGAAERFRQPSALAFDPAGNLYVADSSADTIRKISPSGGVTTVAGSPGVVGYVDGTGSAARFSQPAGLAFGKDGLLYVVDGWERTPFSLLWQSLRTVSPQGEVKTKFGDIGAASPGMAFDAAGNIYLTNFFDLVRIAPDNTSTKLASPGWTGLTASPDGTVYYTFGNSLRKVSPAGVVTTLAGDASEAGSADGAGAQARFRFSANEVRPVFGYAMALDSAGNLYVGDNFNQTIRRVTPAGAVTTVAGVAGVAGLEPGGLPGRLYFPNGLALLNDKTLYVSSGHAVLKISLP